MRVDLGRELTERQFEDLMRLYKEVTYWARERTADEVRKMLANTDLKFVFSDPDTGELIAFARVLTDKVYKAFIFDVIVSKEHQGEGLGRLIMDSIVHHPDLRDVLHFELYCRPEVIPFYHKWGFTEELGGQRFMRRTSPDRIG